MDLFYKIVDLLNEIEDILVKSWLLKQNSGPPLIFNKLIDLLFRKGVLQHL